MYRTAAGAVAAFAMLLAAGTAAADPVAPQADTPCPSDAVGAMTWPADAKLPLTCAGGPSGDHWQTLPTPRLRAIAGSVSGRR